MVKPPVILEKLTVCAILLCEGTSDAYRTWKECKLWLINSGFHTIDLESTNEACVKEVKSILEDYKITQESSRFAAGHLGLALYGFICAMMKYWLEDHREIAVNLHNILETVFL